MSGSIPVAHVRKNRDGTWAAPHSLEDHIAGVAALAEEFAACFGNGDWGRLAGQWHDLGKYKSAFQDYIRASSGYEENEAGGQKPGKVDHSVVGALYAKSHFSDYSPDIARVLGYLIAGHHTGLPDWSHEIGIGGALSDRLSEEWHLPEALAGHPPTAILESEPPKTM
ncbi:MAG: CRISPR-associated endonuclease Cas3'', partial [Spirochaetaceae bacterium]|nr:CRISPR-associated endonuclease Cas3'' [Spirochaetaceae bacterium]